LLLNFINIKFYFFKIDIFLLLFMTMNSTLSTITSENSNKYDYFKLLVDKNKIKLSRDLVEDKIKPKFDKFTSTSYFLNNILNIVITKKLLNNFSLTVRKLKKTKIKDNFKNLLKYNTPLLKKTLIDMLEDALKKTELKIPTGYDKYYIDTIFINRYCFDYVGEIARNANQDLNDFSLCEYISPAKYKKYVINTYKNLLDSLSGEVLYECFCEAYDNDGDNYIPKSANINPIYIKFDLRFEKRKNIEKLENYDNLIKLLNN